jgi:hypothetical protein
MQVRGSAVAPSAAALPAARGWGDSVPGAFAGEPGAMLPGVAAVPVQRSVTGGEVIQRGRKKDTGTGGGGDGKRQGRKSQRDKKHGLMNDPVHGRDFIASLHSEKQKSGRRRDFTAEEVRQREAAFLATRGVHPADVPPQPDRFSEMPGSDTDEDEIGEEVLSEHPEKHPTERKKDDDEDDRGGGPGGGPGGGFSASQQVTVS